MLRGALGTLLAPQEHIRIFSPSGGGPSGLRDRPRPFVFRAAHLNGRTFAPGANFCFNLNVFDQCTEPYISAFSEWHRAELLTTEVTLVTIPLQPSQSNTSHVRVEFLSPTELKSHLADTDHIEFCRLFTRLRDRISTLRALYGPGPLPIDFKRMGERSKCVQIVNQEIRHVTVKRRSSRTGQVHSIGGFTGWAEYEGNLGEFLPYLHVGQWCGVGRQCVWGKGEIRVQPRIVMHFE